LSLRAGFIGCRPPYFERLRQPQNASRITGLWLSGAEADAVTKF